MLRALVLHSESAESTQAAGEALAPLLQGGDVLLLAGDLGAGKTQLTKGLAAGLGVGDAVTSPTFNILLVHEGVLPLYHFDLYRLEREEQLYDIDYFGMLESDGVAVVEWGDKFAGAFPRDGLLVTLEIEGDEARRIEVMSLGQRGCQLAEQWAVAAADVGGLSVESDDWPQPDSSASDAQ